MNVNGLPYHKGERVIDITAERDVLRAENARLREALRVLLDTSVVPTYMQVEGMAAVRQARAALAAQGAE